MSIIYESLYDKYNLREDFRHKHKGLRKEAIQVLNKNKFKIEYDYEDLITAEKYYDKYVVALDIYVDKYDDTKLAVSVSIFIVKGGHFQTNHNFDNIQTAIDWAEEILRPRLRLMRKIETLINDSGIDDFRSGEFNWLKEI